MRSYNSSAITLTLTLALLLLAVSYSVSAPYSTTNLKDRKDSICIKVAAALNDRPPANNIFDNGPSVPSKDSGRMTDRAKVIDSDPASVHPKKPAPTPAAENKSTESTQNVTSDTTTFNDYVLDGIRLVLAPIVTLYKTIREGYSTLFIIFKVIGALILLYIKSLVNDLLLPTICKYIPTSLALDWRVTKLVALSTHMFKFLQLTVISTCIFYFHTDDTFLPNVKAYLVIVMASAWVVISLNICGIWDVIAAELFQLNLGIKDVIVHTLFKFLRFFAIVFLFMAIIDAPQKIGSYGLVYNFNSNNSDDAHIEVDTSRRLTDVFLVYLAYTYVADEWHSHLSKSSSSHTMFVVTNAFASAYIIPWLWIIFTNDKSSLSSISCLTKICAVLSYGIFIAHDFFASKHVIIKDNSREETSKMSSKKPKTKKQKSKQKSNEVSESIDSNVDSSSNHKTGEIFLSKPNVSSIIKEGVSFVSKHLYHIYSKLNGAATYAAFKLESILTDNSGVTYSEEDVD